MSPDPRPTAHSVIRHAHGAADTITLDETARNRRRMAMNSDNGIAFLLDLPEARLLRHGDGLVLDDGRVIKVQAQPEPLYRVTGDDPLHLLQLAWHLGNRHCPSQIARDYILIRRDAVLKTMLEGLGATVGETEAAFDPQGGAYDGRDAHGSGHHHHDHDHKRGHHHHG
ncbi:MAG: urease accessory protein UreE [Alphaproteobacteria bacterium]|nr:urease accessory protein UreE [Alphaproteobacteria bacterium]